MNYFLSAINSLKRLKTRTFLSIAGVAIGTASVILIGYISDEGTKAINSELDSLGIDGLTISTNVKNNPNALIIYDDIEEIRAMDNVTCAIPVMMQQSSLRHKDSETDAMLWGIDSGSEQMISVNILYGRGISKGDIIANSKVCLVDESYAKKIYKRSNIIGKKISILANNIYEEYDIVGVVETGSGILQNLIGEHIPTFAYIPYTTFQSETGRNWIDQVTVKISDNSNISDISASIIRNLENSSGLYKGFVSKNLSTQRNKLANILDVVKLVLSIIGGISLFVAGLGIMTVMTVTVSERTREIGIKKAIGAKRKNILFEFLSESIIISIIGSFIGIGIGIALTFLGSKFVDTTVSLDYNRYVFCLAFSVLIGAVFGVYPANKASKMNPIDALRHD